MFNIPPTNFISFIERLYLLDNLLFASVFMLNIVLIPDKETNKCLGRGLIGKVILKDATKKHPERFSVGVPQSCGLWPEIL